MISHDFVMGAASGAEIAYPSETPEFTSGF
jgi:hypothetical protein